MTVSKSASPPYSVARYGYLMESLSSLHLTVWFLSLFTFQGPCPPSRSPLWALLRLPPSSERLFYTTTLYPFCQPPFLSFQVVSGTRRLTSALKDTFRPGSVALPPSSAVLPAAGQLLYYSTVRKERQPVRAVIKPVIRELFQNLFRMLSFLIVYSSFLDYVARFSRV